MTATIHTLITELDVTDMAISEVTAKVRELGWPGFKIEAERFERTGRAIATRLSKRKAQGLGVRRG